VDRWIISLGVAIGVLTSALVGLCVSSGPGDQAEVQSALERSLIDKQDDKLSVFQKQFQDGLAEMNIADPNASLVVDFIRSSHPKLVVENRVSDVHGNIAKIKTPVSLHVDWLDRSFDARFKNVSLVFEKVPGRRLGFLPTSEWHLSQVQVDPNSYETGYN